MVSQASEGDVPPLVSRPLFRTYLVAMIDHLRWGFQPSQRQHQPVRLELDVVVKLRLGQSESGLGPLEGVDAGEISYQGVRVAISHLGRNGVLWHTVHILLACWRDGELL